MLRLEPGTRRSFVPRMATNLLTDAVIGAGGESVFKGRWDGTLDWMSRDVKARWSERESKGALLVQMG